jgi:hypothetical protein
MMQHIDGELHGKAYENEIKLSNNKTSNEHCERFSKQYHLRMGLKHTMRFTIEIPLFFLSNFVNEKGIIDKKQLEWSKTKSELNRSEQSSAKVGIFVHHFC